MYYCPNCNIIYEISNDVKKQHGGEIDDEDTPTTVSTETLSVSDIIQKIINGEQINKKHFINIKISDLTKNSNYKKLSSKEKEKVFNTFSDFVPKDAVGETKGLPPSSVAAYFFCSGCGTSEAIPQGSVIVKKVYGKSSFTGTDDAEFYTAKVNDRTLPITRNYVCPNTKCDSVKDHSKRAAVFFRVNNTYNVRYVCKSCLTSWIA